MRLSGSFVLPQDAELRPVVEFSETLRHNAGAQDGDFALSRKNSRSHSKIVDAGAAQLIRQFEKPSTIAAAVARFSRAQPDDPERLPAEQILEDALPLLRSLINQGLLVEAGSAQAFPTGESLASGDAVDEWIVARCVQSLEDTELYLVSKDGQWGALKIARPGDARAQRMLEREAELLNRNAVKSLPRLLTASTWHNRPYLVTEWFSGVDAESAAAEIRRERDPDSRKQLHTLGAAILDAYADLHEHGLLHGDIHPNNLLVDQYGLVKILDFGLAARLEESSGMRRGGVGFYFEPEFARATLKDLPPPPASFAGEQYSLAAMLYLLLTGSHTQDFKLERIEMLNQIANGAMAPFAQRGIEAWPAVEQVLAKALSRDPADRYSSTREFAQAWGSAETPAPTQTTQPEPNSKLREIRREVLRKSAIGGEWMREGFKTLATAPINNGGAGLAYALFRIACATDDGELLATADAWSTRATAAIESPEAFDTKPPNPSALKVGLASLHHHRPGVHATQALIASARGDALIQRRAIDQFVAWGKQALQESDPSLDLTLGFAGSLLGAALLLDSLAESGRPQEKSGSKAELLAFGRDLLTKLWTVLDRYAPIGELPGLGDTGVAHGWAGILYASLVWNAASAAPMTESLHRRLDQLAARAEPIARGLHWPWGTRASFPSWCNGSAGQVFLWAEAHKAIGDHRYLTLAEGAAWNTWESPSRFASLCCGLSGQAYALLNFYRYTEEEVWLLRARKMAGWAAELASVPGTQTGDAPPESRPGSLYNSLAGVAVLGADLDRPLDARMPFYERD
jgi:serine/threonine protein kinase